MSMISKTAHVFFAAIALAGMTTPAMANPIASPGPGATVHLQGFMVIKLTQPVQTQSICNIYMTGTVTSVGTATSSGVVTFTSGYVTHQSGVINCLDFSFVYPYVARTNTGTNLRVDRLEIVPPIGASCVKNNLDISYNAPSASFATQAFGTCLVSGSFQSMSNQLFIG
ncbi:MAG: hypothetical protein V4564_19185 [Pseudomonadota bacterium]